MARDRGGDDKNRKNAAGEANAGPRAFSDGRFIRSRCVDGFRRRRPQPALAQREKQRR
jgi:hypothetical protein